MVLSQKHIEDINEYFCKMQSKRDLLRLLNRANYLEHGSKTKGFKLNALTYFSNPNIAKNRYTSFTISKKSGGKRVIYAPVDGLKALQAALNLVLQCVYTPHEAATGFVKDKSIVDNARQHVGNHYVFNTDLKDFFPSIDQARFWGRLQHPPFNLNESNDRLTLANIIAGLCGAELEVERFRDNKWVTEKRYVLPQGAPTSPTISNIIAERLDHKLNGLAKRFGCTYSRYADDLTFSSMHNVYKKNGEFRCELNRIVESENFHLKESKTRLIEDVHRQEVTGLVVNKKVNVRRRYVKKMRMWLYYWEKYGIEKANEIFEKDYQKDKGHVKEGSPGLKKVLSGKLQYMKMVKGDKDSTYQKLKKRYDDLIAGESPIPKVLDIWEEKGIKEAMKFYYKSPTNKAKQKPEKVANIIGKKIVDVPHESSQGSGINFPKEPPPEFFQGFEELYSSKLPPQEVFDAVGAYLESLEDQNDDSDNDNEAEKKNN